MNDDLKKRIALDFGISHMGQEEQERMMEKIGTLLFEAVVERAVDAMDDSAMTDFEKTIETSGEDYGKVISFMKDRVPSFNSIVSDEMSRIKRTSSGIFA